MDALGFFEVEQPLIGSPVCSDPECPCPETPLGKDGGYLYITPELVAFRHELPMISDVKRRFVGQVIAFGPGVASPIAMCETAARKRGLILEVAATDYRNWLKTGLVPLRTSPLDAQHEEVLYGQLELSSLAEGASRENWRRNRSGWMLPAESVIRLEEARMLVLERDYDKAIESLLAVDPAVGAPLRSRMAFCLDQRSLRMLMEAQRAFEAPTKRAERYWKTLVERGGSLRPPGKFTSSSDLPPCPCCGTSAYYSWYTVDFKGLPGWMCRECAEAEDKEMERKKKEFGEALAPAFEYAVLARDLYPDDPESQHTVSLITKLARDLKVEVVAPGILREELRTRQAAHVMPVIQWKKAVDSVCWFCSNGVPDKAHQITVPMCGDVQHGQGLFGPGLEYCFTEVVVPRCGQCWEQHSEFMKRTYLWEKARQAAASEKNFPEALQVYVSADNAYRNALAELKQQEEQDNRAQAQFMEAEAIGTVCDQCKSAESWENGLCGKCDKDRFNTGCSALFGFFFSAYWFIFGAYWLGETNQKGIIPVLVWLLPPSVIMPVLILREKRKPYRKQCFRERRLKKLLESRNSALSTAQANLEKVTTALSKAKEEITRLVEVHKNAKARLQALRVNAAAHYESENPRPSLAAGVRPESDYAKFDPLLDLWRHGWGFGTRIGEDGQPCRQSLQQVKGLCVLSNDVVGLRQQSASRK